MFNLNWKMKRAYDYIFTSGGKEIERCNINGRILQLCKPNENQSIGIILCKSVDKVYVEYAVRDYDKPIGVVTYKTATDMPERLRKALPDMEELKKLL